MKKTIKVKSLIRPIICKIDTTSNHKVFLESFEANRTAVNELCQLILPFVTKYPKIVTSFGIRDAVFYGRSKFNIDKKELDILGSKFNAICDRLNISKKRTIRRDILTVVNDMYLSIKGRHKKNVVKAPIVKGNKAIRSNEGLYKIVQENNQWYLIIEILQNTPLKMPINICNKNIAPHMGLEYKEQSDTVVSKKTYGGVIEYKTKNQVFVAKLVCRIKFNEQYTPVTAIGIDINKRPEAYLAFSDETMVKRPESMTKLVNSLLEANQKIAQADISKLRSKRRRQWRNKQKQMKIEAMKMVPAILDKVKKEKALLCIDGAKPGGSNGEYGQILTSLLRSESERCGIPHIWVDSYYTSTTCVKCNNRDKKNRKSETEFVCTSCGHKEDADIHSAKYIAKLGYDVYKSS